MPASRRDFLYGLGVLSGSALFAMERSEPDLILYNGNFWTVNTRQPRAQAVAISNSRFLAIGSNEEIVALAAGSARKVDLSGKTVLPGFIDAHSHPAEAGLSHLRMVDCDLRSIADILNALRERAAKTPPGEWVLGFKYDDTKTSEGRPLTLQDLDTALPNHPVFVQHRGGHTGWTNSLALKLAQLDDKTPEQTATLILQRLAINEGKSKKHYTADLSTPTQAASTSTPNNLPRLQPFFGRTEELKQIAERACAYPKSWAARN